MELITRTVYGSYLQTCLTLKLPFVVAAHTTLNEKLGIQDGVLPANNVYPTLQYWCIGDGGSRLTAGANGLTKRDPIQHRGTDASPFRIVPFVLREVNNDLSAPERSRYALRREETHGGRAYYAYYLRRIDFQNVNVSMEYLTVLDNVTTVTPFVPNTSHLNPVPPVLNNDGTNTVSGDYTAITTPVSLPFSATDAEEFLNVSRVLYGDDTYATITEVSLVSGVDKTVAVNGFGNTTFNFNEVIAAQVNTHIIADYNVKFLNNSFGIDLDIGSTEPLFVLTE